GVTTTVQVDLHRAPRHSPRAVSHGDEPGVPGRSLARRARISLMSLGALTLAVSPWANAFAACPSTFAFDFSGSQYAECFRDVFRAGDINSGFDLGGTGHTALNFTGSTGSTPSTWLTVYDATRASSDAGPTFGAGTLCADVLIQPRANFKGTGLVALLNEGIGKKGLALSLTNAGGTDTLLLSTVDGDPTHSGKLTNLTSVSLKGGIVENEWYRLVLTVDPASTSKVTGQVFEHLTPADPNSTLGPQLGTTLTYATLPVGISTSGEVGLIASAVSTPVNSSVTNVTNNPVKCGVATTARFVDNGDGTVSDTKTGLMWEQKVTGTGCTHCVDDTYSWSDGMSAFLSLINNSFTDDPHVLASGFAGYSDWRLPNILELQTILDTTVSDCGGGTTPCIDPILGPTAPGPYWSTTILARNTAGAWYISFGTGLISDNARGAG